MEADRIWKISQTSSANLQSRKQVLNENYREDFIPDGDDAPHAIILIFSKEGYPLPAFTRDKPFLKLHDDPALMAFLQASVVDMVVYGRRSPTDRCNIFEDIYPAFQEQKYILREYDTDSGSLSLNRCEEISMAGFLPNSFQLGVPSAGKRNNCNSGFTPILEKHLDDLEAGAGRVDVDMDDSLQQECAPRTNDPSIYAAVGNKEVEGLMSQARDDGSCPAGEDDMEVSGPRGDADIEDDVDLDRTVSILSASFSEHVTMQEEEDWESTSHFQSDWKDSIRTHQNPLIPAEVLDDGRVQTWFMYVINYVNQMLNHYYCRICEHWYGVMALDELQRPNIAKKTGELKTGDKLRSSKSRNKALILGHYQSSLHQTTIRHLKRRKIAAVMVKLEMAQRKSNEEVAWGPTVCLMRSSYFAIKANLPFNSFPRLLELQTLNGIDCGTVHNTYHGVKAAAASISKGMHKKTVQKLIRDDIPLALISDESTSKSQTKYMVILIQTMEDDIPVLYLYRNIEITTILTSADKLLAYMTDAFEEDGLTETMKRNLVSFASDGASVMKSLAKLLDQFTDTRLVPVHCMGHRIQLALNFLKKKRYHHQFEQIINKVHTYYSEPKKRNHYLQTGKGMGVKLVKLRRIIEVRWLPSEVGAISSFMRVFEVIYADLELIANDFDDFDAKGRAQAAKLRATIGNPRFLQYLNFFRDLTQLLSNWNLFVQRRNGVLFEQARKITEVLAELAVLKDPQNVRNLPDGTHYHLEDFYQSLTCTLEDGVYHADSPNGPCREEQMEAATEIIYKENSVLREMNSDAEVDEDDNDEVFDGKSLTGKPILELVLNHVRVEIITKLIEEIESYFPKGETDAFAVFDINLFPTNKLDFLDYGVEDVGKVAEMLDYNKETIVEEWRDLMGFLSQQDGICNEKKRPKNSAMFWSDILRNVVEGSDLSATMVRFLRHIMAIPVGSSDAESSFSILKHLINDRRTNLLPPQVQDSLRIRINGKDQLTEVDALQMAKDFVADGHDRADIITRRRGPKPKEQDDEKTFRGRSKMF